MKTVSEARGRVCMLRHSYYPSDVGSRRQAAALISAGFEVDIICLREPGQPAHEKINGANVLRLPLGHRRGSKLRYVFQYVTSLCLSGVLATALHIRRRYDVFQIFTMPDLLVLAALVPKLLGARVVLHIQDLMPELYSAKFGAAPRHPVLRLLAFQEGASMRLADRVITVTEEFRRILMERHGREDIAVVMNCPDDSVFPRRPPTVREKHRNGHRDSFVLLSHGVMVERLGYDTIVRAVALLRDAIPELEARFAGSGDYGWFLSRLADELGVADRVHVLGYQPLERMPDLISSADLGIVANRNDGFADLLLPTKLLEYVWMGVPAIASRTKTIKHYFDEQMVAFFEPGNAHDLAERILSLYRHPQKRLELAANASRFCDYHNWPTEQARYRGIVADLIRCNGQQNRKLVIEAHATELKQGDDK